MTAPRATACSTWWGDDDSPAADGDGEAGDPAPVRAPAGGPPPRLGRSLSSAAPPPRRPPPPPLPSAPRPLAALATAALLPYAAHVADALGDGAAASMLPPLARAALLAALAREDLTTDARLAALVAGGGRLPGLVLRGRALTPAGVRAALEGGGQGLRALALAAPALAGDAALLVALPALAPRLTRLDCGGSPAADAAAAAALPRLVRLAATPPSASWEEAVVGGVGDTPADSSLPALRVVVWPAPPAPPPAALGAPPGSRARAAAEELVQARSRRERAVAAMKAARPGLEVVEVAPGGVDAEAWAWVGGGVAAGGREPPPPPPPPPSPPPPLAARFAAAYAQRAARVAAAKAAASARAARRAAARATAGERAIQVALDD